MPETAMLEPAQQRPLITVTEAFTMLGISRWTFYTKFVHTNRLKTIKIGRRRLVPVAEIYRLVEEMTNEGSV